jgi:hypothetical protein
LQGTLSHGGLERHTSRSERSLGDHVLLVGLVLMHPKGVVVSRGEHGGICSIPLFVCIAMGCVTMQDGGEVIYHSSLEEHVNLNSQLVDGHVRTSRV